MSHTIAFIYLVLFATTFLGLLVTFGVNTPGFSNTLIVPVNCLFNNIGPFCSFPSYNPPKLSNVTQTQTTNPANQYPQCIAIGFATLNPFQCSGTIGGVVTNVGQAIWNGLLVLGYALSLLPIYAYVFFNKLYMALTILNSIVNVINNDYGVPFFQFLVYGFMIIIVFFGIAVFKPGGHGG